jgi:hypothetical protein
MIGVDATSKKTTWPSLLTTLLLTAKKTRIRRNKKRRVFEKNLYVQPIAPLLK